jgi:acetolactate synthase-1/2/3 large subunit
VQPAPVSFFAYPDKASWLTPESCELLTLAEASEDIGAAIDALRAALGAGAAPAQRTQRQLHEVTDEP